jgi:hypothetical protein
MQCLFSVELTMEENTLQRLIVIAALVIDMMISSLIDVFGNFKGLTWKVVHFVITYIIIYAGGQYLLMGFVKLVEI